MTSILILISKTGGGHISLAEALRDRLIAWYTTAGKESPTIELLDPQPGFIHWHYRVVSRYALWLWAAEFRAGDTPRSALRIHRILTRLLTRKLRQLIEQKQPSLIISTYPFLTYEVMQTLQQMDRIAQDRAPLPFVMLFADPNGVHASWLTERRASATLAPTRETYAQALSVGFDAPRLHLVGWPVRGQFYAATTQQMAALSSVGMHSIAPASSVAGIQNSMSGLADAAARVIVPTDTGAEARRAAFFARMGLDPARFTVFLQGGGEGAARFGETVLRVLSSSSQLQVILAAGTNRGLLSKFSDVERLYALPFTREIAQYMAAADVIMGKAGPNMLFESVTLGKPFIATAYIPGQEEANLEFIRRHQLGWVALTADEQYTLLARLSTNQPEVQAMIKSVDSYRQWNNEANDTIVPLIVGLLP